MASTIKIGAAQIRVEDYVIQANAVLGIRGTGKTTLAKGIAEQLLDERLPIVVFDPTGVWRHLRRAAQRKVGYHGYKVVVAGGEEPDLELTQANAPLIMRSAMTENVSIVFDLYDKKLSKSAWQIIVRECFRVLFYENKGVRHIFLEEAAEFVPQRILHGDTYAEIEKVARMGGNQSLGLTLINQRSQEVNKAVLELCENLVLMKQRGTNAIDALKKWIDKVAPNQMIEIVNSMPNMEAGEAWVFRGDTADVTRVRAGKIKTFHPDRRKPQLDKRAGLAMNVDLFVDRMQAKLKTPIKAETLEGLKAEVKRLTKELEKKQPAVKMDTRAADQLRDALKLEVRELRKQNTEIRNWLGKIQGIAGRVIMPVAPTQPANFAKVLGPQLEKDYKAHSNRVHVPQFDRVIATVPKANGEIRLGKGHRAILTVLAQYKDDGVDETQIAILTGYKATTRYQTLKELRAAGYAERVGYDKWTATDAGVEVLGDYEPIPTSGPDLIDYWYRRLDKGAKKILEILVSAYPDTVHKDELAEKSGYKATTTYQSLKELRARKLIVLSSGNALAERRLFE